MKLKLKNFRCYDYKEFDFGENGLTLISGSSGAGKSTILMAIDFALFGDGMKIISHGKKTCSVELEMPDIKIFRQKGPNRLVVNDVHEDDAGQNIVYEKFGKVFNSIAYIPQNIKKTFILMSPSERLNFMEKFAFEGVDIVNIKLKIKTLIRELSDAHLKTVATLEFANKLILDFKKMDVVPFPIKCSKTSRDKAIKNIEIKYKNSIVLIKRADKELKILQAELSDLKTLNAVIKEKKNTLQKYEEKMADLIVDKLAVTYIGDDKLRELEESLSLYVKHKTYTSLLNTYNEDLKRLNILKTGETEENKKILEDVNDRLWSPISKEDTDEQIKIWQTVHESRKKLNMYQSELDSIIIGVDKTTELDKTNESIKANELLLYNLNLKKEQLHCPHCTGIVRINNGTLEKINLDRIEEDICDIPKINEKLKQLKASREKLSASINRVCASQSRKKVLERDIKNINESIKSLLGDEFESDENIELKNLLEYRSENIALEKQKLNLSQFKYSSFVVSLENKIKKDKIILDSMDTGTYVPIDEESTRAYIFKETRNMDTIKHINIKISEIERDTNSIKKEIISITDQHIAKYKINNDEDTLLKSITDKQIYIINTQAEQKDFEDTLKKINEYKVYETNVQEWDSLNAKKLELETKEIYDRKKYTNACIFRDKIIEAESIAISNIVENINSRANMYLEYFFPDFPMSIKLLSFKEKGGESKPEINLDIMYKGIEYDLNMLSGGETSRVILAFTLAFAEMHNSPIILLDESTSTLDQELTCSVIDGLKENFSDKLVILVAHQVVQGVFDRIINLN